MKLSPISLHIFWFSPYQHQGQGGLPGTGWSGHERIVVRAHDAPKCVRLDNIEGGEPIAELPLQPIIVEDGEVEARDAEKSYVILKRVERDQ